jgi:hypothetical protein
MTAFGCVCEYHDGRFTVLCGAHLELLRLERDHAVSLIEAPIPGLRALAARIGKSNVTDIQIEAILGAAKCVRESGEFREAMYFSKEKPNSTGERKL